MARPTNDAIDDDIVGRCPNWDTIISWSNNAIQDLNVVHICLQMDAIGVGAGSRASDGNPLNQDSVGVIELQMHLRRIFDCDTKHLHICSTKEANSLHPPTHVLNNKIDITMTKALMHTKLHYSKGWNATTT